MVTRRGLTQRLTSFVRLAMLFAVCVSVPITSIGWRRLSAKDLCGATVITNAATVSGVPSLCVYAVDDQKGPFLDRHNNLKRRVGPGTHHFQYNAEWTKPGSTFCSSSRTAENPAQRNTGLIPQKLDGEPAKVWEFKKPSEVGLSQERLDMIAARLGGRGCIVRHGYMVRTWGPQAKKADWLSSSKPVLSTLLFFAIQEGKVRSVDSLIRECGWDLAAKDRTMTFHHLANMISGYARPEPPGKAWAYNDYAINLYHKTLFEKVFKDDPDSVANHPSRFGALELQDGLSFNKKGRLVASVRDFARLCWFWLNKGKWKQKQLLPEKFFEEYVRPQVPKGLPHTAKAATNDYLEIGSYGGGSDHFTVYGPGIYGYNFWFNDTGRDHPNERTWPDAPPDTFMTIGAGGNCAVIMPRLGIVIAAAQANWGKLKPGDRRATMNEIMRLAADTNAK